MRTQFAALFALMIVSGCAASTGAVVKGAGPDDLLKLREGPGLEHKIIMGLPDGTPLSRQSCVTVQDKLWCKVSLNESPSISGYVSADYLGHR